MIDLKLTQQNVDQFALDGFIVLENIIDSAAIQCLRERYDALFAGDFESGLLPDEVNWQQGRDRADATRQICNAWKGDRFVAEVILDKHIGRACATLGGWPGARINQDNCFWKPPGGSAVGFHQDSAYENWVVPSDMVSCWIALDDTMLDGGTVEYIRGSHRWGGAEMIENFHAPADPFKEMRDAASRAQIDEPDHVKLVVPAGGGAFHHGRTWHGSQTNLTARHRRSIVAHCMTSEARHHRVNVSPIYSRYKRFNDDALDETYFPILWRNDGYRTPFLDPYSRREIGWGGAY
ncbi:MAG: phytanoyl-CoA hydroxylase [Gammaproteobacteria bacterium]|jgi:phytanoyl-CoA hydroxylase